MEWKDAQRKNIYFLIDSYSIKMEIPLKKHKPGEAAKDVGRRKDCFSEFNVLNDFVIFFISSPSSSSLPMLGHFMMPFATRRVCFSKQNEEVIGFL